MDSSDDLGMSAKGLKLDEDLPVFSEEVTNSLRLKRRCFEIFQIKNWDRRQRLFAQLFTLGEACSTQFASSIIRPKGLRIQSCK